MIRVGRRKYEGTQTVDPSYEGFTSIIVLMKSHSKYGDLGPYLLKNNKGQIIENVWQFKKVYEKVPYSKQRYSRYSNTIIWEHAEETHIDHNRQLTLEYYNWREKGLNNTYPVRYPVGFDHRHKCVCSIDDINNPKILSYIEARKEIYLKEYINAVVRVPNFTELKNRLLNGENLLIIEVDGPHQESMDYYKEKYNVNDDFITDDTILVTSDNMKILLNDSKHPFGHGYCLAMALLGISLE